MIEHENQSRSEATWIWYPGDFEVWLGNKFNNRRTERGAMFPPFWKQDSHWPTVEFSKSFALERSETVEIAVSGRFNLMFDGKLQFGMPRHFTIPAGEHRLNIKVSNQETPPALYIKGEQVNTDCTWLATYEDKIWIDENGQAHGSGIYVAAGSWAFNDISRPPCLFSLEREERQPVSKESSNGGLLYDFGRETFGYLKFKGLRGCGTLYIYYGESAEEAQDKEACETLDRIQYENGVAADLAAGYRDELDEGAADAVLTLHDSKAFRYVFIETDGSLEFETLSMDYEYAPFNKRISGSFHCNDALLNRIWEVSSYTMDLTTREFFMDGIKRDRWTWSGDAIQSYLMNYYLRFDSDCVKRTIRQLRGKDPVTAHVNTIMDYTFYWFKSVADYYLFTGDLDFVREIYPRMQTMMDYVVGRLNSEGMAEGKPDDWIFVDWTDFPMHKRGTLSFEQMLLCKALEAMQSCAAVLRDNPLENPPQGSITTEAYASDAEKYGRMAGDLRRKLKEVFWDGSQNAFMHAIEDGQMNRQVTKFPNMFAILFNYVSASEKVKILQHVLQNADVDAITTPYMRFYELEALCQMGLQCDVLQEIKSYWGGMLREGATSFWEKYNPEEQGNEHLAMYGRPYGKSLCHAWGASPVYLLGRYFLGVCPVKAGYEEFEIRPILGGLSYMEGA
ncbi:MAG: alpha-rhamnosidase, partial [Prevotella sp.]|nr:alpha-rhamnosidase [Prevotella sp.]